MSTNDSKLTIQELLKHWDTHNANFKRQGLGYDNYPLKLCELKFNTTTNEYFVFRGNTNYSINDIEIIKPIMLEESDRIELKTVQTIELLSNYETHLKENYQIDIPEGAMVKFLEH